MQEALAKRRSHHHRRPAGQLLDQWQGVDSRILWKLWHVIAAYDACAYRLFARHLQIGGMQAGQALALCVFSTLCVVYCPLPRRRRYCTLHAAFERIVGQTRVPSRTAAVPCEFRSCEAASSAAATPESEAACSLRRAQGAQAWPAAALCSSQVKGGADKPRPSDAVSSDCC